MGISAEVALSAANAYTEETVIGGGAIKGKNCTISSITEITGGHRVTFQWTLDDGTVQTETMDVMDGTSDYSGLTNKPGINGVTLSGNKTTADLGISYDDLTDKPTIPSISDCYQTTDSAGTGLEDEDLIPFYNESVLGKSNVTFGDMKSALKSYFDNVYAKPLSYSKSEQDTGLTWIDGKKIYQITVEVTNIPKNNMTQTSHGVSNIATICKIDGVIRLTGGTSYTPLPRVQDNSTTLNIGIDVTTTVVQLKARSFDASGTFDKAYVTFQYTKTTD